MLIFRVIFQFSILVFTKAEWVKLPEITSVKLQENFHINGLQNVTEKVNTWFDNVTVSTTTGVPLSSYMIPGVPYEEEEKQEIKYSKMDFNSVVSLLKTLHKNFINGIPRALKDKSQYLKKIHDIIMINIEDRLNRVYPKRQTRGSKDGHEVDFLSAETALMTISFLTFAVYLIKLVMQVINILKAKKMMMVTPMVTAFARSATESKPKMTVDFETTSRILQLMEDFGRQ